MPQSQSQKTVNTFIKGLVTERGELTFPPDASVDELNCDLRRDGSRRRRLGAKVEDSNELSTFTVGTSTLFHSGEWLNVGGQSGLTFLITQVGSTLYFYNKAGLPYSGNQITGSVNLSTYEVGGGVGAGNAKCQFASINGTLVVASAAINAFYIERNNITEAITQTQISFKVRDFDWQGDIDTYSSGTASPSAGRIYDTKNAGWVGDKGTSALSAYQSATSSQYPPLTLPWYAGKDTDGNFDAAEWKKVYSGSSLTGNGYYILDFFSKVRSGLTTETESSRFKAVASFAGRVFYAGLESANNSGTILFSRQVQTLSELGRCYQRNDPTSEDASDLLDTDGGTISIPDAVNIKYLYAFGANLFVFAENGVWSINGVDNVFRATEYSIKLITKIGILSAESFVEAEGTPFWWSNYGIHTLSFDPSTGQPAEQNLSIVTIQSFWDSIGTAAKEATVSLYDSINKKIYWAYSDNDETLANKFNNLLILDIPLQAFYPWRIEDEATSTDYIMGLAFYSGFGADELALDVVVGADDVVTASGADDVISTQFSDFATGNPAIVLLVRDGTTGKLTMGTIASETFLDWGNAAYLSFAEAGYEFFGDLLLQKNSPYIITYMRTTEEGWSGSIEAGYNPIHESSMLVSSYWDFKNTPSSTAQQAYRYKVTPVVNPDSLSVWDYPSTVISTRLKLRGRGRSMRLRFESEAGKDFVLLGYGVVGATNNRY